MDTKDTYRQNDCCTREEVLDNKQDSLRACCAGMSVDALNDHCFCVSLDPQALRDALAAEVGGPGLFSLLENRCPYVFAARPVFISAAHAEQMRRLVLAIESVVALPGYQEEVLKDAAPIARHDPKGAKSVFFGYDFHLQENGIALIEINTNAGGAMLNAVLAKAQRACCAAVEEAMPNLDGDALEKNIVAMFQSEWNGSGNARPLETIAIVDQRPDEQYLYPEFLLFQKLFQRAGIRVVVADPSELSYSNGALWHGELQIDLVYNRLTDFMLEAPESRALRDAYLADAMVLTPHPRAHALYANKRNLALLTDRQALDRLGVPHATQEILLNGIPKTEMVNESRAERFWAERRHLFFKPVAGYGGRAAYRGDKITKRVWEEILTGDYVAQKIVAPSSRATSSSSDAPIMKFDVRAYVYDGAVQWFAARLYNGQTTNFRTPGGGFAPVYRF